MRRSRISWVSVGTRAQVLELIWISQSSSIRYSMRSWMGGFCENSPSQYTPRPGTWTARNISGIAAEASRHSAHSSSPVNSSKCPLRTSTAPIVEQRRARSPRERLQFLEVEKLVEDGCGNGPRPRSAGGRGSPRAGPSCRGGSTIASTAWLTIRSIGSRGRRRMPEGPAASRSPASVVADEAFPGQRRADRAPPRFPSARRRRRRRGVPSAALPGRRR